MSDVFKLVSFGSDHAGYEMKSYLLEFCKKNCVDFRDHGTYSRDSVDYPDYVKSVVMDVLSNDALGVLICGSGIGMSIAANKYCGIRAALCNDEEVAYLSRLHNNANVLILGSKFVKNEKSTELLSVFLSNINLEERHHKRLRKFF